MTVSSDDGVQPMSPGRCQSCGRQFVPDVRDAPWLHPYHFSGRVPGRSLALMLGATAGTALVVGVIGYFGGAITHWIGVQATDLATDLAAILGESALVGSGMAMAIAIIPIVLVGVGYPALMGGLAGGAVAWAARRGGCRMPRLLPPLGFLAGVLTYLVFLATTAVVEAPFHETSRILEVVDPPASYLLMALDASILVYMAVLTARTNRSVPFCEACGNWYGPPTKASIPIGASVGLVQALSTGSAAPLAGVPVNVGDPARIDLELSHCSCGASDHKLVATVRWDALPKRARGSGARTRPWFETTIPAALGAELEARWAPPPVPKVLAPAA